MRTILFITLLSSLFVFNATAQSQEEDRELKGIIKVQVDGLTCPFCAYGLEKKLKKMENVIKIEINVEDAFALLTIKEGKLVSENLIRKNVKLAGFTAREIKEVKDEN
jgi:copper chaperone CopZ